MQIYKVEIKEILLRKTEVVAESCSGEDGCSS